MSLFGIPASSIFTRTTIIHHVLTYTPLILYIFLLYLTPSTQPDLFVCFVYQCSNVTVAQCRMYFWRLIFFLDQVGIEVVRIIRTCHEECMSSELRGLLGSVLF